MVRTLGFVIAAFVFTHAAVAQRVARFEDVFEWVGAIELEQTAAVLNVSPRIQTDVQGGWIVLDPPEHQIRLYDANGRLKAHYGRKGDGPGEFRSPVAALRTASGALVVIEEDGRFTTLAADASRRLHDFTVRLNNITDAKLLRGDSVLVITTPQRRGTAILHVVDLSAGRIARSFYEPRIPPGEEVAWATVHGGRIETGRHHISITLPLLDSLVLLREDGLPIGSTPLHLLRENRPIPNATADRGGFMEWIQASSFVGVKHANDAGWLIGRGRWGEHDSSDLYFHPRDGGSPVLIRNAPILLGAGPGREFVFDDPDQLDPQFVRIARIR